MSRPHRTTHRLRWALLLIGVVAVVLVGLTGYQALRAKTALEQVAADFDTLTGQLAAGDQRGARDTLASAQEHADAAVSNTQGPGWWLSARLPRIGPNVEAVQTVAEVADGLAQDVLPDVVETSEVLQPEQLRPMDGRIDLAPIEQSAPAVVRIAAELAAQSRRVHEIETAELAPQIARPVTQLRDRIGAAAELAETASRAVRLIPSMLGADGPRRYLFMFQNNAEVRATGGIPGAFAVISARDGKVALGRQGDAATIGSFTEPPTPLTDAERRLFGAGLGLHPQDVNFTPDFPRTAELITGMWRARGGRSVDGVVSVDPVALSYLLRGAGPVSLPRGRELTAANAVQLLLNEVYTRIPDPSAQNDYFAAVAKRVFAAVTSGAGDPRLLMEGLARAASESRLLVWSAHAEEQRILRPTAIAGVLPTAPTDRAAVGAYLNAARAYKLDYFLDHRTSIDAGRCRGGRMPLTATMTLHSRVPPKAPLADYVAPPVGEDAIFGRRTILVTAYFFAPVGGSFESLAIDGEEDDFEVRRLDGRKVFARSVALEPGETRRVTVEMMSGRGQTTGVDVRVTPAVRSDGLGHVEGSVCR